MFQHSDGRYCGLPSQSATGLCRNHSSLHKPDHPIEEDLTTAMLHRTTPSDLDVPAANSSSCPIPTPKYPLQDSIPTSPPPSPANSSNPSQSTRPPCKTPRRTAQKIPCPQRITAHLPPPRPRPHQFPITHESIVDLSLHPDRRTADSAARSGGLVAPFPTQHGTHEGERGPSVKILPSATPSTANPDRVHHQRPRWQKFVSIQELFSLISAKEEYPHRKAPQLSRHLFPRPQLGRRAR
jgi:hypothetical protein